MFDFVNHVAAPLLASLKAQGRVGPLVTVDDFTAFVDEWEQHRCQGTLTALARAVRRQGAGSMSPRAAVAPSPSQQLVPGLKCDDERLAPFADEILRRFLVAGETPVEIADWLQTQQLFTLPRDVLNLVMQQRQELRSLAFRSGCAPADLLGAAPHPLRLDYLEPLAQLPLADEAWTKAGEEVLSFSDAPARRQHGGKKRGVLKAYEGDIMDLHRAGKSPSEIAKWLKQAPRNEIVLPQSIKRWIERRTELARSTEPAAAASRPQGRPAQQQYPRVRVSRLDPYAAELLKMDREGRPHSEMTAWLARSPRDTVVHPGTVDKWLRTHKRNVATKPQSTAAKKATTPKAAHGRRN